MPKTSKPKKKTYKQMMAEILKPKPDIKKDKPKGIGGGKFDKVQKI
jgi:hypothetical protein|tara:strand:- start:1242 stop:1379 length:138 start_codon:yes stop_codon:yes gene_type:complete